MIKVYQISRVVGGIWGVSGLGFGVCRVYPKGPSISLGVSGMS